MGRFSTIRTVGVHFFLSALRSVVSVISISIIAELTISRIVPHISTDATNNLRDVSTLWLPLVEDFWGNVRFSFSQSTVENSQFSKLVSFEIVLPHRRRDGLFNDFIGQLDGLSDLGSGICGDQNVQIIVRTSGSGSIGQFSVFHRSLAPNSQLGPAILLKLSEGVASRPQKQSNEVYVWIVLDRNVELFAGLGGLLVVRRRIIVVDGGDGQFHQCMSFLFEQLPHLCLSGICSVTVLVILWSRLTFSVEVGHVERREIVEDGFSRTGRLAENLGDLFYSEEMLVCIDLFLGQVAGDDGIKFLPVDFGETGLGSCPSGRPGFGIGHCIERQNLGVHYGIHVMVLRKD